MRAGVMPTGLVKWFDAELHYGFIVPDDGGEDVFVHVSAVARSGLSDLRQDQLVAYELAEGRNGKPAAVDLKVVG